MCYCLYNYNHGNIFYQYSLPHVYYSRNPKQLSVWRQVVTVNKKLSTAHLRTQFRLDGKMLVHVLDRPPLRQQRDATEDELQELERIQAQTGRDGEYFLDLLPYPTPSTFNTSPSQLIVVSVHAYECKCVNTRVIVEREREREREREIERERVFFKRTFNGHKS